jgi:hypothetical protein
LEFVIWQNKTTQIIMKKKISKNEKLVLRKDTITRLNSVHMQQLIGGGPPVRTSGPGSCLCDTMQGGNSQNSQGGTCYTCESDCSMAC